jgi:hypothetical protein
VIILSMPSERSMRATLAILSLTAILAGMAPAQAEKRIFIIANNADGYGVDRCLANGANCGTAAATSYCRSHEFNQAISFRKIDRDDITGAIPTAGGTGCHGANCDEFVAIECTR